MASEQNLAHAQAQAPKKKQDDFDMVKLKKSLKQEHRRSLMLKHKVAKLSPAEIRSLNYGAGLSEGSSIHKVESVSLYGLASSTPPLTPDNPIPSHKTDLQAHSSNVELPTPPQSPARERSGSEASTRHIHAPRPVSHAQSMHLASTVSPSRAPSASSYRGVATYRGPEITRTGSLTMLQHPSQQIVSNPLSQFSRPRQSTLTSSPPPQTPSSEHRGGEEMIAPVPVKGRHQSLGNVSTGPSREHSPIRPSDSPVSMYGAKTSDDAETRQQPPMGAGAPVIHVTPRASSDGPKSETSNPTSKQKLKWRKTLTGSLNTSSEPTPLKKEQRRRSLISPKQGYCLHTIRYDDVKPGAPPTLRDSLKDELPSAKTSLFKDNDDAQKSAADTDYAQHPAVRPLSMDIERLTVSSSDSVSSSTNRGKEREADTAVDSEGDAASMTSPIPSYSRCSCCGRLAKPGGFESDLSPVMENEHLRTNFAFEVERMQPNRKSRASSINSDRAKHVPIIPMQVGNETKQARIEPPAQLVKSIDATGALRGVAINKPGDVIGPSSTPLAIMPRLKVEPRMVRFASLHAKNDDRQSETSNVQDPAQSPTAPATLQRFGSLYGVRSESQPQSPGQGVSSVQSQQPPSAYEAQQSRPFSGYRPVRSSRLAYQEKVPPTPSMPHTPQASSTSLMSSVEKPLGDFSASSRAMSAANPQREQESNDDEPMVDLSSVDGSFVHNSLSRSATILRETSPPTTSYNINPNSSSTFRTGYAANVGRAISPALSGENRLSKRPSNVNTSFVPLEDPNAPIGSAISTTPGSPARFASQITELATAPLQSAHRSTTVVRIIPSAPVSGSSSPSSSKGPLKLGDWVLPESPVAAETPSGREGGMSRLQKQENTSTQDFAVVAENRGHQKSASEPPQGYTTRLVREHEEPTAERFIEVIERRATRDLSEIYMTSRFTNWT